MMPAQDPDSTSSGVSREQRLRSAAAAARASSACSGAASAGSAASTRLRLARARPGAAPPARRCWPSSTAAPRLARPEQIAGAALGEIGLGQRETRRALAATSASRRARLVGQRAVARAQEADPRPAAPPHPPAQLVELRDAEAIRLLDDHDGRVRHVDAQLDDGGRDQHVQRAVRERAQRLLLRRRRSAPRAAGRRAPGAARAAAARAARRR